MIFTVSSVLIGVVLQGITSEYLDGRMILKYVGCFKDSPDHRDLYVLNSTITPSDLERCGYECYKLYFRYAAVQNGNLCICISSHVPFGERNETACDMPCASNSTQICGGELFNSVYDTGRRDPGPPSDVFVSNATATNLHVTWEPPLAPNGHIQSYKIKAEVKQSYTHMRLLSEMTWTYPESARNADVLDLHPGAKYLIKICAESNNVCGYSATVEADTLIGCPTEPSEPTVLARNESYGLMTVFIPHGASENGPVTSYRVVVSIGLAEYSSELLDSYENAQTKGLSFYIAAELPYSAGNKNFTIGDGQVIGGYFNPPLPKEQDVHITLGVGSSKDNHTCFAYSVPKLHLEFGNNKKEDIPERLEEGLIVAIVVCSILLLLVILAYFAARHLAPKRRGATNIDDPQEMCLQGPMIEVENFGYVPEEEEMSKVDHFDHLKKIVWEIPWRFLDICSNENIGSGTFGSVTRGTVMQNGFPIPSVVHCIQDGCLSATTKRSMLQELALLVRCSSVNHSNVVRLVGTCETPEMLYVVLEHHPATLKDMLLESRTLERAAYNRDLSRVCSLPQQAFLQIAVGVAQGMGHLANNKVVHKQLAASSVLMADGMVPKISNFGIAKSNRPNVVLDFTRWTAREIFRSQHYTVKSDVWSMGCLLWEMAALGGTPYSSIGTSEVASRVLRGMRPPHLGHISDDLYQVMLQCWQIDLDERPTFNEIACILCELIDSGETHLDWSIMPGFQYEQYLSNLEQISQ